MAHKGRVRVISERVSRMLTGMEEHLNTLIGQDVFGAKADGY
jgi:hypothetical protein